MISDPTSDPVSVRNLAAEEPKLSPFPPLQELASTPPAERISFGAVVLAVLTVPLAALMVGGAWHLFGDAFFDLVFISAILAGVGAGYVVGRVLTIAGTRHSNFVAWCGIIAAVLTMASRLTWDAYSHRGAMIDAGTKYISAARPDLPASQIRVRVGSALNPWETLRLYGKMQSREGISIGRARAGVTSDKPLRLTGGFFWGLIILETAAMALAGGVTSTGQTIKRHCAECGKPLKENLLFRRHRDQVDEVSDYVRNQDWQGLMLLAKPERPDPKNMTDVVLYRCEQGGCPATVSVETQTDSTTRQRVLNAWISPESANAAREASIAEPI